MMRQVSIGRTTYLVAQQAPEEAAIQAAAGRAGLSDADPPPVLYWDAGVIDQEERVGSIAFSPDGLDTLFATGVSLGPCLAVELGVGRGETSLVDMVRRLSKSSRVTGLYLPGLEARIPLPDLVAPPASDTVLGEAIESVTVAILCNDDGPDEGLLSALMRQDYRGRLEVVVLLSGSEPARVRAESDRLIAWGQANPSVKLRRFVLAGEFDRAYLANVAAALAVGEVILFVDPGCLPQDRTLFRRLAAWAGRADVATASAALEHSGHIVAAGLQRSAPDFPVLEVCTSTVAEGRPRLLAAPAPWIFAVKRQPWVVSGGARAGFGNLWTAPFAGAVGPSGRHVLVEAARIQWGRDRLWDLRQKSAIPDEFRPSARRAIRLTGTPPTTTGTVNAPAAASAVASAAPITTPAPSRPETVPALRPTSAPEPARPVEEQGLRVLVFCDQFGPSQEIAFSQALAQPIARGEIRLGFEAEAALAGDPSHVAGAVAAAFERHRPGLVVVSRLGDADVWTEVEQEARRRGLPILCHIDDDLFSPPPTLGIERFRKAAHPRRLATLRAALRASDLTIVASPVLRERALRLAGHHRVACMPIGSAGVVRPRRPATGSGPISIGYMGSASHDSDLAMIAPALNRILETCPGVTLSLFGSIAKQPSVSLLPASVRLEPGVYGDYAGFRRRLAELRFDIGLAPLQDTGFNRAKTATKWIEYAEAGTAVIASDVVPYSGLGAEGALLAVGPDGWEAAIRRMVEQPDLRQTLIDGADRALERDYGWSRLESFMSGQLNALVRAGTAYETR